MSAPDPASKPARAKSKRKVIVLGAVGVALAASAGYTTLKPQGDPRPVPGEVETLEPIQLNLAGEHYLRLSLALQLTEEATEIDGSRALDAAIAKFSGLPVATVNDAEKRLALKEDLAAEIEEIYQGDVMALYSAEFVTQ